MYLIAKYQTTSAIVMGLMGLCITMAPHSDMWGTVAVLLTSIIVAVGASAIGKLLGMLSGWEAIDIWFNEPTISRSNHDDFGWWAGFFLVVEYYIANHLVNQTMLTLMFLVSVLIFQLCTTMLIQSNIRVKMKNI